MSEALSIVPLKASSAKKVVTPSKAEKLRERVIEVALKHFSLYGYEGASMRKIAKDAKTSHSLILYHFESKDLLWSTTMESTIGNYVTLILKDLYVEGEDSSAAPALRKFIERFVRMSAERPEIHRILTMASMQHTEMLNHLIRSYLRQHFDTIVSLIRKCQQEGSVRQCDPIRLYYHIIGAGGTTFALSDEFEALTGRNVFSETEIYHTIAFIFEIVFND